MKTSLIISFNPDVELLKENLSHLSEVMDQIVIVDNNSDNKNELYELEKINSKITVLFLDYNEGIAKATNIGFSYLSSKTDWILVLDQDSILEKKDINQLYIVEEELEDEKIGMVVPRYRDRNVECLTENEDSILNGLWEKVDFPIASGSLVSVEAWKQVEGYDEFLFIDRVDDDFDLRLRKFGFNLIQANKAVIDHSIGKISNVTFFGKTLKVYNHSPFRKYFQARNNIIFAKKHGGMMNAWNRNTVLIMKTLLFERHKLKKMRSILRGMVDGIKYKR